MQLYYPFICTGIVLENGEKNLWVETCVVHRQDKEKWKKKQKRKKKQCVTLLQILAEGRFIFKGKIGNETG